MVVERARSRQRPLWGSAGKWRVDDSDTRGAAWCVFFGGEAPPGHLAGGSRRRGLVRRSFDEARWTRGKSTGSSTSAFTVSRS